MSFTHASMTLHFDDADPVATCTIPGCRWHGHGDAMRDATDAWVRHLAADHRKEWGDDRPRDSDHVPSLEEIIFQAIGHASVCWDPAPGGVFDSEQAKRVADELVTTMRARGAA